MKLLRIVWLMLTGIFLASGLAFGADGSKPVWLTECSLGIKESYDNNVFLSGATVPAYTVPAGSVAALKDCASWITTVSPKVGINFSSLLGAPTNFPTLALTYAPDFAVYHDQSSESYTAHRLLAAVKGGSDSIAFNTENTFTYIDGAGVGPFYPVNLYSAMATTADRERRRQIQDRANVSVQFDAGKLFFRPVASLIYYDLMTEQRNVTGYQNYADRCDVNGGADFGYKFTPKFAVTLGYRYGQQYQEQFGFTTNSSPSDYQRLLFGVEGNPARWLNVKIVGGPDFRNYEGASAGHVTPVNDLHPVKFYGEALLTATCSPRDTLNFKYKLWQWVSGTGKVPYFEGSYDLSYHRKLTDKLGLDLGGKILAWDYSSGNLPTCRRNDLEYSCSGTLNYNLNSHLSFNLACGFDWGRNAEDNLANAAMREFDRQLVSVGTTWKF
jgi:hypothetical protein